MTGVCLKTAIAALFAALALTPASAQTVDISTLPCKALNEHAEKKDTKFVNGVLNWMGGYHATEAQGTIVDFKLLSDSFDKTIAYCGEHPGFGVMSASSKFMGEHIEEAGPKAIDVSVITCGEVLDAKDKDTGDTFMWLDGFHTSTKKDSKILDFDKLAKNIGLIVNYCADRQRRRAVHGQREVYGRRQQVIQPACFVF